ncbi:MAG: hypothetical protein ACE5JP_02860 [Candidatus Bipolaricaulia bacterium]
MDAQLGSESGFMQFLTESDLVRLRVDEAKVWGRMGYRNRDPAELNVQIREAFNRAMVLGQSLLHPVAGYRIMNVEKIDPEAHRIVIGGIELISENLIRLFGNASQLVVFVSTLGLQLEAEVQRLAEEVDDLLTAYILDTFASEALMSLTQELVRALEDRVGIDGNRVTRYWYCPGYGDWDIREQQKLFQLIDTDALGVNLNRYCAMKPRKSYSGLIGIGPKVHPISDTWDSGNIPWVSR